jgi:hypothetical protein
VFRKTFKLALLLTAAALAAFLTGTPRVTPAQSRGTEAVPEIKFEPGTSIAVVSGSVQLPHGLGDMHNDGADRYSLHYRAGQRLTFNLESEGGRAVFSISRMGAEMSGLPVLKTRWSGRLPQSGDYYVTVWTNTGAAKYKLKVSRHPSEVKR